jgi:hypothetical protein
MVSLDGTTQDSYGQYRRGGKIDLVMNNCRELIEFELQSEDSGVIMRAYEPVPTPAVEWRMAIKHSNDSGRSPRTKHLEIKNPAKDPETLLLVLYGRVGHPYRLTKTHAPVAPNPLLV